MLWFLTLVLDVRAAAPAMPKLELPPPAWQLDASRVCYRSGLLLHLVRRPQSGVVALSTAIGGGDSAETDATRGAAHLVEHLWFRSRPDGGPRPWDLAGLQLDGTTLADATVYTTVGAPRDLRALLELEAQRLRDPLQGIDEATVQAEKVIVASELAWRGEQGGREAARYLSARLWPAGHPYASGIPSAVEGEALTLDALRAYVRATYTPQATSIRIEGDVDPATVADLVAEVFPEAYLEGDVKSCERSAPPVEPSAPVSTELAHLPAAVDRPRLYAAWSLPPGFTDEDTARRFAVDQLERVIWWPQLRYLGKLSVAAELDAGCEYEPGWRASQVTCTVDLPVGADVDGAWGRLRHAVEQPWSNTVHEQGFLKNLAESTVRAWHGAFASLDRLDRYALSRRGMLTWLDQMDPAAPVVDTAISIEAAEVAAILDRWLTKDRMVGVVLVPAGAKRHEGGGAAATARLEAPEGVGFHVPVARDTIDVGALGNGLAVWTVRRPDAPVMARTALVSRGGSNTSPEAGLNEVLEALERYDLPISLSRLRREVALDSGVGYGSTADWVEATGSSGNLGLALWVLRGLTDLEMDFSERQVQLDPHVEAAFGSFRDNPWSTSRSLRTTWLLPGDRAGMPWWEHVRAARYVGQGDVLAWQKAVRHPGASVLVVASDLDTGTVRGVAETWLGGWKGKGEPLQSGGQPAPPPPPAPRTWVLAYPSALSDVRVTCRVPGRTDDNAGAFAVLESVLGRGLLLSVREDRGTYANDASLEFPDPRVGWLTLNALVAPSDAADTQAVLVDLLARVRAGAPEEVIGWARVDAGARHARSLVSAVDAWSVLHAAASEGRTPAGIAATDGQIAKVTVAEVSALLTDCAGHEATTLIGPDPGGLPDAERLDWAAWGTELARSLK